MGISQILLRKRKNPAEVIKDGHSKGRRIKDVDESSNDIHGKKDEGQRGTFDSSRPRQLRKPSNKGHVGDSEEGS